MTTPETPASNEPAGTTDLAKMIESQAAAKATAAEPATPPSAASTPRTTLSVKPKIADEIQIAAVPQANLIVNSLPTDFKGWLMLFLQNPALFVTIMDGTSRWMAATTFVGKEEALHLVGNAVAVIMDRGALTVSFSINANATEDQLADELCAKMLAVPRLQSLGIQGSSGLQVNRGEILRKGWTFFQKVLPILLPLLMGGR